MTVKIKEDFIKLDSLLKLAGIASTGGHAKIMITEGQVLYNGEVCLQRGRKVRPGDSVTADGEIITVEKL
jgi:S4 domain-containing protein